MNKYLQNLAALLAIALLGWGAYYVMAPAPQTETNRNLTLSTPVIADKTVKSEETALPLITASKQKTAGSTSPAPSGEMHLAQPQRQNTSTRVRTRRLVHSKHVHKKRRNQKQGNTSRRHH